MPEQIEVLEDAMKALMTQVVDAGQWDRMPAIMLIMAPNPGDEKHQLVYIDVPPNLWDGRHPVDVMMHLAMLTALPSQGGLITDPGASAKLVGLLLYNEGYALDSDNIPEAERAGILAKWNDGDYPIQDSPYGKEMRMFLATSVDGHRSSIMHFRDTEYTNEPKRDDGDGDLFAGMRILLAAFQEYYEGGR